MIALYMELIIHSRVALIGVHGVMYV